jgi:hypothetical protein
MGFTEPDTPPPPDGVPQMPQASMPGIAPAPYSGPDERPEPPDYSPMTVSFSTPGVLVLAPAEGGLLQESAYAHDINAGLVAQFVPGDISPITVGGNADSGGRDDVAGSVAGAVANAEARYLEHEGDTHGSGSTIGDVFTLPPGPIDPGSSAGEALPTGAYFDPPREY